METVFNQPWFIPLVTGAIIVAIAPLAVAFTVLLERKVLADMQARLGPMRVGPNGSLQTLADAVKLLLKEDIVHNGFQPLDVPSGAGHYVLHGTHVPDRGALSNTIKVTDVNVGLLVVSAMSAVGILGIILGGWSSNSHYSLLGGLRSAAQLVSYEVAIGLALMCGVMCAGSLSLSAIVNIQKERGIWFVFDNYGLMIVPMMVYLISSVGRNKPRAI